ncbi:MAG: hypothetical protein RLZZ607_2249, partial [Pseudomonadota bacterium]
KNISPTLTIQLNGIHAKIGPDFKGVA